MSEPFSWLTGPAGSDTAKGPEPFSWMQPAREPSHTIEDRLAEAGRTGVSPFQVPFSVRHPFIQGLVLDPIIQTSKFLEVGIRDLSDRFIRDSLWGTGMRKASTGPLDMTKPIRTPDYYESYAEFLTRREAEGDLDAHMQLTQALRGGALAASFFGGSLLKAGWTGVSAAATQIGARVGARVAIPAMESVFGRAGSFLAGEFLGGSIYGGVTPLGEGDSRISSMLESGALFAGTGGAFKAVFSPRQTFRWMTTYVKRLSATERKAIIAGVDQAIAEEDRLLQVHGGSFTALPVEHQESLLGEAYETEAKKVVGTNRVDAALAELQSRAARGVEEPGAAAGALPELVPHRPPIRREEMMLSQPALGPFRISRGAYNRALEERERALAAGKPVPPGAQEVIDRYELPVERGTGRVEPQLQPAGFVGGAGAPARSDVLPQRLYHGSVQVIEGQPKLARSEYGPAIFLADNPNAANQYAAGLTDDLSGYFGPKTGTRGSNVTPFYIQKDAKILDLSKALQGEEDLNKTAPDFVEAMAKDMWVAEDVQRSYLNDFPKFLKDFKEDLGGIVGSGHSSADDLRIGRVAKSLGYDVIKIPQVVTDITVANADEMIPYNAYAVLNPDKLVPALTHVDEAASDIAASFEPHELVPPVAAPAGMVPGAPVPMPARRKVAAEIEGAVEGLEQTHPAPKLQAPELGPEGTGAPSYIQQLALMDAAVKDAVSRIEPIDISAPEVMRAIDRVMEPVAEDLVVKATGPTLGAIAPQLLAAVAGGGLETVAITGEGLPPWARVAAATAGGILLGGVGHSILTRELGESLVTPGVRMERVFAMPNRWTFNIPPIKRLVERVVGKGEGWVDPFAGQTSPAQWRNDLSPTGRAQWHMEATKWSSEVAPTLGKVKGVLFDPPYSPRQISEVYKSVGLDVGKRETQNARLYASVKDALAPLVEDNGYAVSFGWNSSGFGWRRGFAPREVLIVNHGVGRNDTIVLVEQKIGVDAARAIARPSERVKSPAIKAIEYAQQTGDVGGAAKMLRESLPDELKRAQIPSEVSPVEIDPVEQVAARWMEGTETAGVPSGVDDLAILNKMDDAQLDTFIERIRSQIRGESREPTIADRPKAAQAGIILPRLLFGVTGAAVETQAFNENLPPWMRTAAGVMGAYMIYPSIHPALGKFFKESDLGRRLLHQMNPLELIKEPKTKEAFQQATEWFTMGRANNLRFKKLLQTIFDTPESRRAGMYAREELSDAPEWANLSADQQKATLALNQIMMSLGVMGQREGVLNQIVDRYVSHRLPPESFQRYQQMGGYRIFSEGGGFTKTRKFPTLRELEAWAQKEGVPPPIADVTVVDPLHLEEMYRAIGHARLWGMLEKLGVIQDAGDLGNTLPAGVRRISILNRPNKFAPEDVAVALENLATPGRSTSAAINAIDVIKSKAVHAIMFWWWEHGLNNLRAWPLLMTSDVHMADAWRSVKTMDSGVMEAARHGLNIGTRPDISAAASGRFEKMLESMKSNARIGPILAAGGKLMHKQDAMLWDQIVPTMQYFAYMTRMRNWVRNSGGKFAIGSPEYVQAARAAAGFGNTVGGRMVTDFSNPKFLQFMRILMFSPQWTTSRLNIMAQAGGEMSEILAGRLNIKDAAYLPMKARQLALMTALTWLGSEVIFGNAPTFNPTTHKLYMTTNEKSLSGHKTGLDLLGWWQDDLKLFSAPLDYFLAGRLSPVVNVAVNVKTGRDFYGRQLTGPQQITNIGRSLGPIPSAISLVTRVAQDALSGGTKMRSGEAMQLILRSLGTGNVSSLPRPIDAMFSALSRKLLHRQHIPATEDNIFELTRILRANFLTSRPLVDNRVVDYLSYRRRSSRADPIGTGADQLWQEARHVLADW